MCGVAWVHCREAPSLSLAWILCQPRQKGYSSFPACGNRADVLPLKNCFATASWGTV